MKGKLHYKKHLKRVIHLNLCLLVNYLYCIGVINLVSYYEKLIIQSLQEEAEIESEKAFNDIKQYHNILFNGLKDGANFTWKKLYDNEKYRKLEFTLEEPKIDTYFQKLYVPKESVWEKIIPSLRKRRIKLEEQTRMEFEKEIQKFKEQKKLALEKYEKKRKLFESKQNEYNKSISDFKNKCKNNDIQAIEKYLQLVIKNSNYPETIINEFEVQFIGESGITIIDYCLPHPDTIPNIIEYKLIKTRKEIIPKEMKKKEFEEFYENIIYQITLRTIYELFESDFHNKVQSIIFNGWVQGIDTSTGQDFNSCLLSVQVSKRKFSKINLSRVNPKDCFKSLKGISAGALKNLAPIKPIMNINREDSRFTESKNILAEINSIPNLAEMNWEDFEHLVRGLFEQIFSKDGGEVKVTQASRDGGVDAIAFDPDPIRGGKFVIQAKRYNNVVPVSAVRDLYGTMISEGAVKGIIVTTSYYGNDSREFVKDKPITLIDGSNLVHLFNDLGHNVRIQIKK